MWEYDQDNMNMEFLNAVDSEYFSYLSKVHAASLASDERQYAALALRSAYAQGLETLFALLCAVLQSPDCMVGWMVKYRPSDMVDLVKNISNYKSPQYLAFNMPTISWEKVSNLVHLVTEDSDDNTKSLGFEFGKLWGKLAHEFVKPAQITEYNSIKHGMRVKLGGTTFQMGLQDVPGTPAPPERMRIVGHSEFGTVYFEDEKLHKHDFRVKRCPVNWNPQKFVYALQLIAMSINNVVAFAKFTNGADPAKVSFMQPTELETYNKPWAKTFTGMSFQLHSPIEKEMMKATKKEEIFSSYKNLSS